jgi:hypothetical protein
MSTPFVSESRGHPAPDFTPKDARNAGDATLYDLEEAHGPGAFPVTFEQNTGGGWHKLYRLPEAIKPKTGELKGKLGPGVDVKGAGGYIVAAPSMHASGRRYEVGLNEYIAEAPAWIVAAVKKSAAGGKPEKAINGSPGARKGVDRGGRAVLDSARRGGVALLGRDGLEHHVQARRAHGAEADGGAEAV